MAANRKNRIVVTGGHTVLGIHVTAALVAEGAEVTALVPEGMQDRLGGLRQRVNLLEANVWDAASLKGRARGHGAVIHTVGSMQAAPEDGFTYHYLNLVPARNVASMCISDGVPHLFLMSAVAAPWFNRKYVNIKREAERIVLRPGLGVSVIRAPLVYERNSSRSLFFRMMSLLGMIPPLSWLYFGRIAPMPVDILARGVARLALENPHNLRSTYYARHLRRLNTRQERRGDLPSMQPFEASMQDVLPFEELNDDPG